MCAPLAGTLQRLARGEVEDFEDFGVTAPAAISRLAAAGAGGRNRNVARDVQRTLTRDGCLSPAVPELYSFPSTLADGSVKQHFVLLPHEYMSQLFHHCKDEFDVLFGDEASVVEFWEREVQHMWAQQELLQQHVQRHAWPVGLHGDDTAYVKNGRLLVLSLGLVPR